ncbi:hypothetical protein CDL12_20237 [Handroanthus impetiginosus]|uniref:Uncharacterized protein n=1 Tax=Handroanthus impetiginosus TaxID=429701 RepID=A0A2G9GPR4_9LAMI|nr:hypothetical protein CDL12_20237 [Handroanthus impetiginosus]
MTNNNNNNKGVIINIYKESKILRSNNITDPIKKINPKSSSSRPRVFKTRGYDRRAQILAHAQELRHSHAEKAQLPFKNSTRKRKRWAVAVQKIRLLFSRVDGIKRKWRYEPIATEDYINEEPYCDQGRMKRRKGNRRRSFHFCRKLKCFLKKISRVWKCKNGGC